MKSGREMVGKNDMESGGRGGRKVKGGGKGNSFGIESGIGRRRGGGKKG